MNSSIMIGNVLAVVLIFNRFICNKLPVLPDHSLQDNNLRIFMKIWDLVRL